MKRFIYYSITFLLLLILFSNSVYGNIVYDVTSLNINSSNGTLQFKGWAYYPTENNIGGDSMTISIVAEANGKQYFINNKNYGSRNLYLGICLNHSSKRQCVPESDSACHHGSGVGKYPSLSVNSCLARNIDFNITFKVEDLINKLSISSTDDEITFFIRVGINKSCVVNSASGNYNSIVNGNRLLYNGKSFSLKCTDDNFYYEDKKIGVHSNRISLNGSTPSININDDGEGSLDINGTYSLSLNEISNKINIFDSDDLIQQSSGIKFGKGIYFNQGYNIIDGTKKVVDGSGGTYQVDLYPIKGYSSKTGSNYNYALASWFETEGQLKLKIGEQQKEEEVKTCSSNSKINANLSCGGGKSYNATTCKTYEKTVYFPSQYSDKSECSYDLCIGSQCYIKSKITANVNFIQTGYLKFIQNNLSIYSGGPTDFSITYENSIYWTYKDKINFKGYTDYYESTCCTGIGEDRKCVDCCKPITISAEEVESKNPHLLDLDKKEYSNAGEYIKKLAKDELNTNFLDTLNSESSISVPAGDIKGSWKENSSNLVSVINNGYWESNTKISSSYTYNIFNAFINRETGNVVYRTTDDMGEDYLFKANTYYIPLNKKSGTYNFEFKLSDLSFMKNNLFTWTAVYNCGVSCTQKFYSDDNKGFKFNYRTIDITNVFPNNNAGSQWENWINSNSEYSNGSLESLNIDNLTVHLTSDTIDRIRDYNNKRNENDGYLDNSIDSNGDSKFLSEFGFKNSADHYKLGCGLNSQRGECP